MDPFSIEKNAPLTDVLSRMGRISFQGRNLSLSYDIWKDMLQDEVTILFGLAGAMVPAGMRRIVAYLIEHRLVDGIVSTGANLFHDIHETLGQRHWMGQAHMDDGILKDLGIDRIYDTFAVEEEFYRDDTFVGDFAATLDLSRSYSTHAFLYLLGRHLGKVGKEKGILTQAAEHGVPVFCPAIGDSSIGIALAILSDKKGSHLDLDPVADVLDSTRMIMSAVNTGVIYVGGGTPKNFIQQTEVTATYLGGEVSGHKYAVQFTADAPHWGGLSGCTFEEAQSWGKIQKKARMVSVHVDATIALPLVVSALSSDEKKWAERRLPVLPFSME